MTKNCRTSIIALIWVALISGQAFADSTIDPTEKFAHGANVGWINFKHDAPSADEGVVVGEYAISGFAYGANFGWVDFGDGSPANGIRYQNDSGTDFGVNHDGEGNLSGLAYGANVGWINFGWASEGDSNRPRFELNSGDFKGYAYGANIGWINLSGFLKTGTILCRDADQDGIADAWEIEHFGNLVDANASSDGDGDSSLDADEYLFGTGPNDPSSFFVVDLVILDPQQVSLQFPGNQSRVYRIEISTDLSDWSDSGLGSFLADNDPQDHVLAVSIDPRSFFRILVSKALQP